MELLFRAQDELASFQEKKYLHPTAELTNLDLWYQDVIFRSTSH